MKIETVLQDLRYAARTLRRSRSFSLTLLLVLALGIGGSTTMFTLLHGIVLNPLPFRDPHQLIVFNAPGPPGGDPLEWWSQCEALSDLCSYGSGGINLTEGDLPARVQAAVVSANFLEVFDVAPQLGRPFVTDDETPGHNQVTILSSRLWTERFGRDPGILEQEITLDGIPHTVIGVMPTEFGYPGHTDIWVPRSTGKGRLFLSFNEQADLPSSLANSMVGRLRADMSLAQARSQIDALFVQLKEISARSGRGVGDGFKTTTLQEALVRDYRSALIALFAAVVFLLLIACANAANLMLAHATTRQKEMAIRLSLGARPLRVVRQLLTESVLLAVVSGAVGVLLAYWGVDVVRAMGPSDLPGLADVRVNITVLCFALGTSLLVGVTVGLVPALQSLSTDVTAALKDEGHRSSSGLRRYLRNSLVVIEVALALVLAIGAGLTVRSFFSLTSISPGFDVKNILTMAISLPIARYVEPPKPVGSAAVPNADPNTGPTRYRSAEFHHRLKESIESLPGVVAFGGVNQLPLSGLSGRSLWIDVPGTEGAMALFYEISADYFTAMGISLVHGRAFTEVDIENAPKVVVVNETLARRLWGGRTPLGETLRVGGETAPREIVGIVGDTKQNGLAKETGPQFYLPYLQPAGGRQPRLDMTLVVRTTSDPRMIAGLLRSRVALLDKDLPTFRVNTMEEVVSQSTSAYRFRGILLATFAALALIVATVGVYGVVAYSVSSRTHEIGVRMSLGARPLDILLMILREGAVLALVGVGIGTAAAFGLNRFISNLLYGITPNDPATLIVSGIVLFTGALLACMLPASAASRLDPAVALRHE